MAALASLLSINTANAVQEVSVDLQKLKVIQEQEKSGDELYFSVTEVPLDKKWEKGKFPLPKHYQVPAFPSHWLSKYADKIHDVTLWKKTGKGCESTDVLFSLVEEDTPPWNLDDLLGSVKLQMRCENGKTVTHWEIPDSKITASVPQKSNTFSFTGDGAEYSGTFKVEQHAAPTNKKDPRLEALPARQTVPIFP